MKNIRVIIYLLILIVLAGCSNEKKDTVSRKSNETTSIYGSSPATINYGGIKAFPHDTTAFTEGFVIHKGKLYESTGSPPELVQTKSLIGIVDLNTGKLDVKVELDKNKYFGEGIVILKNKIYQLTYLNKVGFEYDLNTFKKLREFPLPGNEGWGMTTNGTHLIMSDGSSHITYLSPITFKVEKILGVFDNNGPLDKINELEYIKGYIYANIYTTSRIVKIDPTSGRVIGDLHLSSLVTDAKAKNPDALEMNGIAYDEATDKIYVTGKFWPNIYEITFNN